jgi:hypothetical protein
MSHQRRSHSADRAVPGDDSRTEDVIRVLWEAQRAAGAGDDVWQLAIELPALQRKGVTRVEMRQLVRCGLVHHAVEVTSARCRRRRFQRVSNLSIPEGSCFILSPAGVELAQRMGAGADPAAPAPGPNATPHWDGRVLRYGDRVVKRFRVPAEDQKLILDAFQEEGWPPHIDDPLPQRPSIDAPARLRGAVYRLNHRQCNPLLLFESDGTGQGVSWQEQPAIANGSQTDRR